jgi:WXG100 family type VII secretion target
MAGESAVNRQSMATAYQQLQTAVDEVKAQQQRLAGYQGDLQSGWTGMASSAFTSAYEAFNADFTKVITALQGLQEKMVTTQQRYTVNEQEQAAAANKVTGLLNH